MSNKSILFIPAYNCEKQIVRVLASINLNKTKSITQVIVIDNKSTDDTLSKCIHWKATFPLKIISHTDNYGLGGSFKTAYKYAVENNYMYIYWLHGDDQACFSDLIEMEKKVEDDHSIDCVFGSRFSKGSELVNYTKKREYANRFLNKIFSIALGQKVLELGSGLNAYKVKSIPLNISIWPEHIAFDVNLLFHFLSKNYLWLPIKWNEKDQVTNASNIKVTIKLIWMLIIYCISGKLDTSGRNYSEYESKVLDSK
jgi:glycosyltransferase involved in cell wall biosynthesis